MGKYNTPGMEGIGGMIRKDMEDEKKRLKEEQGRHQRHGDSVGTSVRKAAYAGANHFDNGLKRLVGL